MIGILVNYVINVLWLIVVKFGPFSCLIVPLVCVDADFGDMEAFSLSISLDQMNL